MHCYSVVCPMNDVQDMNADDDMQRRPPLTMLHDNALMTLNAVLMRVMMQLVPNMWHYRCYCHHHWIYDRWPPPLCNDYYDCDCDCDSNIIVDLHRWLHCMARAYRSSFVSSHLDWCRTTALVDVYNWHSDCMDDDLMCYKRCYTQSMVQYLRNNFLFERRKIDQKK